MLGSTSVLSQGRIDLVRIHFNKLLSRGSVIITLGLRVTVRLIKKPRQTALFGIVLGFIINDCKSCSLALSSVRMAPQVRSRRPDSVWGLAHEVYLAIIVGNYPEGRGGGSVTVRSAELSDIFISYVVVMTIFARWQHSGLRY